MRVALFTKESMVNLHVSQGLLLTQVEEIKAIIDHTQRTPHSSIQSRHLQCLLRPGSLSYVSSRTYVLPTILASYSWLSASGLSGTIATSCADSDTSYSITLRLLLPHILGGRALTVEALIHCYTARLSSIRISKSSLTLNHVVQDDAKIMNACNQGDLRTVQSLFQSRRASPSDITSAGRTPLLFAIKGGHYEMVKLLLNFGADVNTLYGDFQMSPLQLAVQLDHLEICRLLLAGGASTEHTDARGWTAAFYLWPQYGLKRPSRTAYLALLNLDGACDFSITALNGWTALHWASSFGTAEDVAILSKYGSAAQNCTESIQWSPLHFALHHQNETVIQEFLKPEYQVNVHTADARGWTPLHFAAWSGTKWLLIALLDLGVDPYCLIKAAVIHVPKSLQNREFTLMQTAKGHRSAYLETYLSALRQSKLTVSIDDEGDVF